VGRGIALTRQGHELLGFARELRDHTDALMAELCGTRADTVVLASGEGTLLYLLDEAIRRAARLPGVKLRIVTRDREGTLAAVASGEAHLGITTLDVVPDGLSATALRRSGMVVAMPRGHRLARRAQVRLTPISQGPLSSCPPPRGPTASTWRECWPRPACPGSSLSRPPAGR
jgi:DNA-binding transcriptional LysR family regulator